MALGSQISVSVLAYQSHFLVQMCGWKGGLEPGNYNFEFSMCSLGDHGWAYKEMLKQTISILVSPVSTSVP